LRFHRCLLQQRRFQNQSRTALKHRKRPLFYGAIHASVPNIIVLNQQLPVGAKNASVRKQNVPISPVERNVYTVTGDLWRVKMEDNDDEYHLEISATGAKRTADRIVAEIPPDFAYAGTRRQLLSMLPGNYVFKPKTSRDFTQPIPIRVTGYAFFDGHHWSSKSVRGNKHGTKTQRHCGKSILSGKLNLCTESRLQGDLEAGVAKRWPLMGVWEGLRSCRTCKQQE
jgi:hypothetical protein